MNPIVFALRHPITTMMLVVTLIGGGALALNRMRIDIFPPINQPKIIVFTNYGGYDPGQMEGLLVSPFEFWFQFVDGVRSMESKSIQQVAVVELSFYPDTDMSKAMAQVVSVASRAQATQPDGTLPPLIIQLDPGNVPVGYLVFKSKTHSLGEIGDLAQYQVRPLQTYVPGTVATAPFGSAIRAITVSVDPDKLRSYNLTPQDVVNAVNAGNFISPSGNLYAQGAMPLTPTNAMVRDVKVFGSIPLVPGRDVYLRDVAKVADATDINYGYAMVDGRKSTYVPIIKKNTASTLQVVSDVRKALPIFKSVLPEDVDVSFAFDESPTVVTAVRNVATEGLIGASLTGLMILIFLRDLRSVVVVVFNIPMALLGSLCGLWMTGNTINIMTLGGLALAIGILVDEATVEIENIHVQMELTPSLSRAVLRGNHITAVPRLLALLCILSVFIPAFIMNEPVRSLFLPLSLAVGFAMISSYLLSSTVVPVLSVWLLKHSGKKDEEERRDDGGGRRGEGKTQSRFSSLFSFIPSFARMQAAFGAVVGWLVHWRWLVVPTYLVLSAALLVGLGPQLGRELFPQVDSGEFVVRFCAPPGSNFEITRQIWTKALQVIQEEAGAENVAISMGFAGQVSPLFSVNNLILFMRGPDDGQMRVALREDSGIHLQPFREKLRKALPEKVKPWLAELLQMQGLTPESARARAEQVIFGFEPGDMVSTVMSFGSPAPIEVVVAGPKLADSRAHAQRILAAMKKIPSLRDVKLQQELDYPTVPVEIDRERAGLSGATARQVANAVVVVSSSSRYVARNFWVDSKNGTSYQVQVEVPTPQMNAPAQLETVSLAEVNPDLNLMIRDVARVGQGTMPGEIDRTSSQRYVSITANVEGEDLGRAAGQIRQAIADVGDPPRGVRVLTRGQVAPMHEMFTSLGIGLGLAVVVILVLLTAYFESPRLALASVSSVPGVLCGVVIMLLSTGTTLNIESFMGAIMCIGVSVSNSVMLVTFIAMEWQGGKPVPEAARAGAQDRLRPILMTACAMTIGMVPMALALEHGSEMQAPLGRAVIGGLLASTFVTLLIVPSIFALLMGRRVAHSPSLYPDDPDSSHYDHEGHDPEAPDGDSTGPHPIRPEAHS